METLNLLHYTKMILGKKAEEVTNLGQETQDLIDAMITTCNVSGGLGLSAPQVGINQQIFVYRKKATSAIYKAVINPSIIISSGKTNSLEEGCLSVPGRRVNIKRFKIFKLTHWDRTGKVVQTKASNKMESIILQHEFDHLMGLTILDR